MKIGDFLLSLGVVNFFVGYFFRVNRHFFGYGRYK